MPFNRFDKRSRNETVTRRHSSRDKSGNSAGHKTVTRSVLLQAVTYWDDNGNFASQQVAPSKNVVMVPVL